MTCKNERTIIFEEIILPETPEIATSSIHTSAKGSIPGEVILSTPEFFGAIWEQKPRVAVFDCDGTLWSPDAGSGFMKWTIETKLLSKEATKWLTGRHAEYRDGKVDEETICGEMVTVYQGIPEKALRESAREYFKEHIQPYLFPELISAMQELQEEDVEIWAVSSTNNWMIEEALRELGITHEKILAACVEVVGGVATDQLRYVPTGPTKAVQLRRVGIEKPDVVFGNSVHDVAMMEMAKRAFPVNPSEGLQKVAVEKSWPVYYPAAIRPA